MASTSQSERLKLIIAFFVGQCITALVVFGAGLLGERPSLVQVSPPANTPASSASNAKDGLSAPRPYEMAQALKQGGYILYFRHPERQKWDSVIAFDVYEAASGQDASSQSWRDSVCLTPRGKEEAKMIGAILKTSGIPVGFVASSPICRARQTAELAFGRIDILNYGLIHTPVTNSSNELEFKQELQKLLRSVPIQPGTNTVISGHEQTIRKHPDLFDRGTNLLQGQILQETGLYVIERNPSGSLDVVQKYMNLGDLASNAITLKANGPGTAARPIDPTHHKVKLEGR